jgi:ion channel
MRSRDYHKLLAGIVFAYVMIIAVPYPQISGPLQVAILATLLWFVVHTRRQSRARSVRASIVGGVLFAMTLAMVLVAPPALRDFAAAGATAFLVVMVIVIVGRGLLAAGTIDLVAVRGVLAIYLLFALFFGAAHEAMGSVITNYLHGVTGRPTAADTLYFSVITLATVGYGDISPASSVARALAASEGLLGQLYLVSVVAAVIGNYQRPGRGQDQ